MIDVSEFLDVLDDDPFEEIPVNVNEFVSGQRYLNLPPLSNYQIVLIECMSQIYREKDLLRIMGEKEGREHYNKYTKNEIIMQLGKGCHAPYTRVFDSDSGKWQVISSMAEGSVATMYGNSYATEAFKEGLS